MPQPETPKKEKPKETEPDKPPSNVIKPIDIPAGTNPDTQVNRTMVNTTTVKTSTVETKTVKTTTEKKEPAQLPDGPESGLPGINYFKKMSTGELKPGMELSRNLGEPRNNERNDANNTNENQEKLDNLNALTTTIGKLSLYVSKVAIVYMGILLMFLVTTVDIIGRAVEEPITKFPVGTKVFPILNISSSFMSPFSSRCFYF